MWLKAYVGRCGRLKISLHLQVLVAHEADETRLLQLAQGLEDGAPHEPRLQGEAVVYREEALASTL